MPSGHSRADRSLMRLDYLKWFDKVMDAVFAIILLFITLGVILGVANLFVSLGGMLRDQGVTQSFQQIISDVLTLFILIELSRSLVEYFQCHRLRLTFIIDAGIVFVLRELMIKLFEHKVGTDEVYAMAVLILVLGALRTAAVLVYQREKQMQKAIR